MRLCYVWSKDFPWDIRTAKIIKSLVAFGHEVHMVCRNLKRRPRQEQWNGATLHRLPVAPSGWDGLNYAANFPFFFNPLWLKEISRVCREHHIRVLIVRDLPLALPSLWVGRRLEIPTVLDMAENYPAMVRDITADVGPSLRNFIVRNPYAVSWVERVAIKEVDHLWVVVEESSERLVSLGVPPEKITIVSNTPQIDRPDALDLRAEGNAGPVQFVYLGFLEIVRGLSTCLDGFSRLLDFNSNWQFKVIGSGRDEKRFQKLAQDLRLGDHVEFCGWLDHPAALDLVRSCDVGLIPHYATESWNTTIPNKLFDYMSMGLPVLASDVRPVRRVLEEVGCGIVFRARDKENFARKAAQIAFESDRAALGRKGQEAIREKYNWNNDSDRMQSSLLKLIRGSS